MVFKMKTKIILVIMALTLSIFGLMSCGEDAQNSIPTATSGKNDLSKTVEVKAISAAAQGLGHVMFHNEEGDVSTQPIGASGACSASGWGCDCSQKSCPAGQVASCMSFMFYCDCDCEPIESNGVVNYQEAVADVEMRILTDVEMEAASFYSEYLENNSHDELNAYFNKYVEAGNAQVEEEFYIYAAKYLESFESLSEEMQEEINLWIYNNNPMNN